MPGTYEKHFESILERPHVRILVLLQLERNGGDLDRPAADLGVLSGFEAQEEVAGILGINAESVVGAPRVCLAVRVQPLI